MNQNLPISRRCFLRRLALVIPAAGLAMSGAAGCKPKTIKQDPATWYVNHQEDIVKENKKTFAFARPMLVEQYGDKEADAIMDETITAFTHLLPDLPYIGGSANDLTANLTAAAAGLAFYRVMQQRGAKDLEIGRLLYQMIERQFTSDPMAPAMGRLANSKLAQDKIREAAKVSNKRVYAEDWVFDFVPGDSQNDFGVDYTECGIVKYFKAQNAENFTPYLCLLDFPISRAMNTGLVRTGTLAHGDARCDFRYKSDRDISPEWDPGYIKGASSK